MHVITKIKDKSSVDLRILSWSEFLAELIIWVFVLSAVFRISLPIHIMVSNSYMFQGSSTHDLVVYSLPRVSLITPTVSSNSKNSN